MTRYITWEQQEADYGKRMTQVLVGKMFLMVFLPPVQWVQYQFQKVIIILL